MYVVKYAEDSISSLIANNLNLIIMRKFFLSIISLYMIAFFLFMVSVLLDHNIISKYEWDNVQITFIVSGAVASMVVFSVSFTSLIDEYKK